MDGLSRAEYDLLQTWTEVHGVSLPEGINTLIHKLLRSYWSLFEKGGNSLQLLRRLREQMGFTPKSEKGSQEFKNTPVSSESASDVLKEIEAEIAESEKKILDLNKSREELLDAFKRYGYQIGALKRAVSQLHLQRKYKTSISDPNKEDLRFMRPEEAVFTSAMVSKNTCEEKKRVDRMALFERVKGMHSSTDKTIRYEMKVLVTQIEYEVETVTDPLSGKSVRACMDDEGPAGSSLTWLSYENLLKMHAGFATPIHRIELMLGHEAFSAGKMYRALEWIANFCLPIYLHLPEALSDAAILSGDDTPIKVLDLSEAPKKEGENIHQTVDESLKWRSGRADGKGDKKALNVTLITGRVTEDPRSTIHFFRTHIGSYGNLLTRILEIRNPKKKKIVIQGDLSSSNKPEVWMREKFEMIYAGCGAHGRRPFWRHRNDDREFCYYVLQCFLIISQVEKMIDAVGRTEKSITKYRRYAKLAWKAIYNRCQAAITGERPTITTDSRHAIRQWPPQTYLYDAAKYILEHYEKLTYYLKEPRLNWTNNDQERGLRFEKCLQDAAKFKGNRNGRTILDILRTILATCTAAQVEVSDYLRWIYKNRDHLKTNPQDYAPFAYAQCLDTLKLKQTSL